MAAIACPPAAPAIIALGATYGTLELGSAVSGKDWMTERELDTGERWLRGAFSLLDIVPGVKGVHAFSKAARGVPEAVLKVAKQSATNLKTAVKQGATTVQGMLDTAAMKALERVRAVKESARESARIALKRAEPGMIKTAQKADELLTSLKNIKLPIREPVPVEGAIPAAENTHRVENFMKSMINKLEDKLSPPPRTSVGGVEGADALKEQIRKRVLENIEKSKTAREASNYGVYLRKEKEVLAKIEKKALDGTGEVARSVIEKEKWLESLQNTENFKQGTKENGLNHIFDGEILKNGNANGFHYEGMPNSNGKIVGNVDSPNEFGVYQANVKINGVLKGPKSTFFPKEWTPQQVIDSVNEAFNNKVNIKNNKYIGKTSTGMEIELILRNDKIISAYPIY